MYKKKSNFKDSLILQELIPSLKNIEENLINNLVEERCHNNKNELNNFEFKAFSQNGEDGLIHEIFKRIGLTNKVFVEFGVQDGLESNSTLLLFEHWQGLWIEADDLHYKTIQKNFTKSIANSQLKVEKQLVTSDNFESILDSQDIPIDFDMLSIDIDSNDYWVWKSLKRYKPRLVIIEYNAFFPPWIKWVKEENEDNWDSTIVFGASLLALKELGDLKGYKLVACSNAGVNAFFVRQDLVQNSFNEYSIEEIYKNINYKRKRILGVNKRVEI
jgi:hypothetical protein